MSKRDINGKGKRAQLVREITAHQGCSEKTQKALMRKRISELEYMLSGLVHQEHAEDVEASQPTVAEPVGVVVSVPQDELAAMEGATVALAMPEACVVDVERERAVQTQVMPALAVQYVPSDAELYRAAMAPTVAAPRVERSTASWLALALTPWVMVRGLLGV